MVSHLDSLWKAWANSAMACYRRPEEPANLISRLLLHTRSMFVASISLDFH